MRNRADAYEVKKVTKVTIVEFGVEVQSRQMRGMKGMWRCRGSWLGRPWVFEVMMGMVFGVFGNVCSWIDPKRDGIRE